jgi:Putative beta-barrel porin-2, OmpL-like. bbp2
LFQNYRMKYFLILASIVMAPQVWSQVTLVDSLNAQSGRVTLEGYLDTYYAYDFNKPPSGDRPYFVSSARHNEMTINLAYLALKYSSTRLRATVTPGFGTYMNANYAQEPGTLGYLLEANAGIKLWSNKNIWIDAGVISSPYSSEGPISKDQLLYTRSFAPEYVPYYLSGIKLTVPLSEKLNAYLYLINGWQQIQDQNNSKSIGTQLEYQISENWLVNWNIYIGNEESNNHPEFRTRYFTDVYFRYTKERWLATGCFYYGTQQRSGSSSAAWWQANLMGQYSLTKKLSIAGRVEYFNDPKEVQITPITGITGFNTFSSSLGINLKVTENALFRVEGRTFLSEKSVYLRDSNPVKNSNLLAVNLTVWF